MSVVSFSFFLSVGRPMIERHFALSIKAGFRTLTDWPPTTIVCTGVAALNSSLNRPGGEMISIASGVLVVM